MLGADGGSRAGLLFFTCPGLPIGGLWPGTLLGSLRFTSPLLGCQPGGMGVGWEGVSSLGEERDAAVCWASPPH